MGLCGSPHLSLLVFVVLGVAIAAAGAGATVEEVPGDAFLDLGVELAVTCRPIDPCRGRVANEECCKAINAAIIAQGGCACVCKVLNTYGAHPLPAACLKSSRSCSKCSSCACS